MKKCRYCAEEIQDEAIKCKHCGACLEGLKKCRSCAEEIQELAVKCKHCGEFLNECGPPRLTPNKPPWYFGLPAIVLSLLTIGPLALPLVWIHPRLHLLWKIAITGGVLVLSWFAYQMVVELLKPLNEAVKMWSLELR